MPSAYRLATCRGSLAGSAVFCAPFWRPLAPAKTCRDIPQDSALRLFGTGRNKRARSRLFEAGGRLKHIKGMVQEASVGRGLGRIMSTLGQTRLSRDAYHPS